MSSSISASLGTALLSKSDRLFRNDNTGIFIELLQNARRAGATVVNVKIEPIIEGHAAAVSRVTFSDNGHGIEDFKKLLTLGDSGWDQLTMVNEDPAGMGFFSLSATRMYLFRAAIGRSH